MCPDGRGFVSFHICHSNGMIIEIRCGGRLGEVCMDHLKPNDPILVCGELLKDEESGQIFVEARTVQFMS
jgi:hypothetical protein